MKNIIKFFLITFILFHFAKSNSQSLQFGIQQSVPFLAVTKTKHEPIYVADTKNTIINKTEIENIYFVKTPGLFLKYNKNRFFFSTNISVLINDYNIIVYNTENEELIDYSEYINFNTFFEDNIIFIYEDFNFAYFPFRPKKIDFYLNISLAYNLKLNYLYLYLDKSNKEDIKIEYLNFYQKFYVVTSKTIPMFLGFAKIGLGVEYYLFDFNFSFLHNISEISSKNYGKFFHTIKYFEFSISYSLFNKHFAKSNFKDLIIKEKNKWQ